ncbi:hypothetical protein CYMTET_33164 [Cymbomonas tetramitiformis]|uniref:CSC1/OSCA1-like cytosolic domain-containing protein n=1 Tax=Cymbomonas tetramitiformis TaxID=36881 RepID=A0AAE0KR58_9CHLO|nr:hypothetical protein CYMTET_33164 [Cymbomonas tetramitiformis]
MMQTRFFDVEPRTSYIALWADVGASDPFHAHAPGALQQELRDESRSMRGQVVEVELVRDDEQLLSLGFRRFAIIQAMSSAEGRSKRMAHEGKPKGAAKAWEQYNVMMAELQQVNFTIRQLQQSVANGTGCNCVCAFVTFREEQGYCACLHSPWQLWWRKLMMPQDEMFRGKHRLRVSQVPEPSDLIWENLDYDKWAQRGRRTITAVLKLVVLLISFALITLSKSTSSLAPEMEEVETSSCRSECDYTVNPIQFNSQESRERYYYCAVGEEEQAVERPPPPPWSEYAAVSSEWNLTYHVNGTLDPYRLCLSSESYCYHCYCTELLNTGAIFDESAYCEEYLNIYTFQAGAMCGAVLTTVIINLLLAWILSKLAVFEKHHSITEQQSSIMNQLALSQFINTGIVPLLVNAEWADREETLKGTFLKDEEVLTGKFADLTPGWYEEVGRTIIITVALTPMVSQGAVLAMALFHRARRKAGLQRACTQEELNRAFEGPDFLLSTKYGDPARACATACVCPDP